MNVLALDPGKTTGWAVPEASGTLVLERPDDAKLPISMRHGLWFARARHWLDGTIDRYRVEAIALERQPIIRGSGSMVTIGLRGVFLEVASGRRLMVDEVPPGVWQTWAKGYAWVKAPSKSGGDEVDAAAILAWWQAVRLPLVREG